jgi:hypothetical protein
MPFMKNLVFEYKAIPSRRQNNFLMVFNHSRIKRQDNFIYLRVLLLWEMAAKLVAEELCEDF